MTLKCEGTNKHVESVSHVREEYTKASQALACLSFCICSQISHYC